MGTTDWASGTAPHRLAVALMLAVRWWLSLTRGIQPIVLAVRVAWLH